MASCYIVTRQTKGGDPRYHVRFEAGRKGVQIADGSTRGILHIGVFDTHARAKDRRKWALNEWAAGRVPDPGMIARPLGGVTVEEAAKGWVESRVDVARLTRITYAHKASVIAQEFGATPAQAITEEVVRAWIAKKTKAGAAPATVRLWMNSMRQILDFARVEPNPLRSRRVKGPKVSRRGRKRIPAASELALIRPALLQDDDRLILDFLEQTGARISGVVALRWGDIDYEGRRVLVRETKTESSLRWVLDDPPIAPVTLPERPEGARDDERVFRRSGSGFSNSLKMACERVGVRTYSPHDLRHLHASRCLKAGMDPARLAARLGHANPGITLGMYTHELNAG